MKGMGSVERVLVLGIVVVIVAILGIAVWGATDDDAGALDTAATDGGAVVDASGVPTDALPMNITPPDPALTGPMSDIERIKALRDQRRDELAGGTTQQVPGASTLADGGSDAALGTLPVDPAALPAAGGVPLNHVTPVDGGVAPGVVAAPPVQQPVVQKPVAAADAQYTVASGDSLWKIAHKHYGSGDVQAHIDAILAANPTLTENLKVGQKITLPSATTVKTDPARLPADKQAAEVGGKIYVVKDGDTLSTIAKKELGSAKRWNEIYELNRARLSDPAKITVGMKLTLPQKN